MQNVVLIIVCYSIIVNEKKIGKIMKKTLTASLFTGAVAAASLLGSSVVSADTYHVKSGDTLYGISLKYNTTVSKIKSQNGLRSDLILVGQNLNIGQTSNQQSNNPSQQSNNNSNSTGSVYTVKSGDTLNGIASKLGVSVASLANRNNIKNINFLSVGQRLEYGNTTSPETNTGSQNSNTSNANNSNTNNSSTVSSVTLKTYTVKSGDTLNAISQKTGVSVIDIATINHIQNINMISVGQVLNLNKETASEPTKTVPQQTNNNTSGQQTTYTTYKVKSGDTLYGIAASQNVSINDLLRLNNLSLNSIIYVNQNIKLGSSTTEGTNPTTPSNSTSVAQSNSTSVTPTNNNTAPTTNNVTGINTNGLTSAQASWLNAAAQAAKVATAGTGVRASVTVAQAIIESGWGQSGLSIAPYNNLFGIKASYGWYGRTIIMRTSEFENGGYVTVNSAFRAYDSMADSFKDHTLFLLQNSRYAQNGVINSSSYQAMAQGLQNAGYATSPTYASTLIATVNRYHLDVLD